MANTVFVLLVAGLVLIAYLVRAMNEASAARAEQVSEDADKEAAESRFRARKYQEDGERKVEGPGRVSA